MFGGAKPWSERIVAEKPCKECGCIFKPSCGGNLYCADCAKVVRRRNHAKGQREWRAADPQRHVYNMARHNLKKYGLTVEDYFEMLSKQGGKCAICLTNEPKGRGKFRQFAVDHCHKSGRVRALLCNSCNGALGMVSDKPEILLKMIDYLKEHSNA